MRSVGVRFRGCTVNEKGHAPLNDDGVVTLSLVLLFEGSEGQDFERGSSTMLYNFGVYSKRGHSGLHSFRSEGRRLLILDWLWNGFLVELGGKHCVANERTEGWTCKGRRAHFVCLLMRVF